MIQNHRPAVRLARAGDAPSLLSLRSAAEQWLAERGIQQWGVGEVSLADIAAHVDRAEWFVSTNPAGGILAALRFLDEDTDVWPDAEPGTARYVHGLVVDRVVAPPGAGAALLRWAEQRAAGQGVPVMRLDCVESNTRLRRFYTDQGYRQVGRRDFDGPWFSAALFEKHLVPTSKPMNRTGTGSGSG